MPNSQRSWSIFWRSKAANIIIAPNANVTPNQPKILRDRYIGVDPNWGTLP